jgi:hypothetical protein
MNEYEFLDKLEKDGCIILRGYTVTEVHPKYPLTETEELKLIQLGYSKGKNFYSGKTMYFKF